MASTAYPMWVQFLEDSRALAAVRETYGRAGPVAYACLTRDASNAPGRAAIVALSAAFEAYVVALFEHTALALGHSASRTQQLAGQCRFSNPRPRNVRDGFRLLDMGFGIWAGISTASRSMVQLLGFVGIHQVDRHHIAHGVTRKPYTVREVAARLSEYEEIAQQLDRRAADLVQMHTGHRPW
jgi:hypothetical protein